MVKLNSNFSVSSGNTFFRSIDQKLADLKLTHPHAQILNFGVGDVALPLAPSIAQAITQAMLEMTTEKGMRGYRPHNADLFLRETIVKHG